MDQRHNPDQFDPVLPPGQWNGRVTRAEVSLDAVASNVAAIRRHVRGAEVMAVVKADAYGHGAVAVAGAALLSGATRLGVYTAAEGVSLRMQGVTAPILVFGPFEGGEAKQIVHFNLTPTLTSLESAELLAAEAKDVPVAYHVKVDTGLTRAGIQPGDAVTFLQAIGSFSALRREGIFTHLARADEPDKTSAQQQLALFHQILAKLDTAGFVFRLRHAANSAATLDLRDSHLDLVRVGIATYGYYPSGTTGRSVVLRPALSLVSAITRLTEIEPGTGVGYGHTFRATRRSRIALIPVGYGDGLPRALGCGVGTVLVGGEAVRIVGRVSMDQITVDVTDIEAAVGSQAVIIGAHGDRAQTADDLAERLDTISYEVLTRITQRVPRLYSRKGRVVGTAGIDADIRAISLST